MSGTFAGSAEAWGPVVATVAVVVLGFASRWVFAPSRARRTARTGRDFGLLVPVLTVARRADADRLQRLLGSHQVRATVTAAPPGPIRVSADGYVRKPAVGWHVLVFEKDADRARDLVSPGDR